MMARIRDVCSVIVREDVDMCLWHRFAIDKKILWYCINDGSEHTLYILLLGILMIALVLVVFWSFFPIYVIFVVLNLL